MIESEGQVILHLHESAKCTNMIKKTFLGLRRQLTFLKLTLVFVPVFIMLTLLTSFLYDTRNTQLQYISEQLEIKNVIHPETHRHRRKLIKKPDMDALSPEEMKNVRNVLDVRKRSVEHYCGTIDGLGSNLNNTLSNMIIDVKHGISWCPTYKAASSTWMKHFAQLGGKLTAMAVDLIERGIIQVNTIVKQAFPREADIRSTYQKLNQTKKFLIVRHPLERLVSAYRDKLEHMDGREYYYKRFGRHIALKYRRYRNPNDTKLEPTFTEFLRFIVDDKYFDEHWAPFFDTCQPCLIRYDYILKFDTFNKEQAFLIQELGLGEYLYPRYDLRNTNQQGVTTNAITKEYLQDVPREILDKIIKIYEKDFVLFSYSLF